MGKAFYCKDLGMDCPFEAHAETEEELMKQLAEVGARDRRLSRKQIVKRRTQAIDVARRSQFIKSPIGLFGRHVRWRSNRTTHLC